MKTTIAFTVDVDVKAEAQARIGKRELSPLIQNLLIQWLEMDRKKTKEMTKEQLKVEYAKSVTFAAQLKKDLEKIEQEEEKETPKFKWQEPIY